MTAPAAAEPHQHVFTEHERWLFDLHGVLTIDHALTPSQCDSLNAALDAEIAARVAAGLDFQQSEAWSGGADAKPAQTLRLGDFHDPRLALDAAFLKLVDNPRISPYLDAMFSAFCQLPSFRRIFGTFRPLRRLFL